MESTTVVANAENDRATDRIEEADARPNRMALVKLQLDHLIGAIDCSFFCDLRSVLCLGTNYHSNFTTQDVPVFSFVFSFFTLVHAFVFDVLLLFFVLVFFLRWIGFTVFVPDTCLRHVFLCQTLDT